jgi:succinyl-diaminopimelate desuccinylase
LSGSSGDEMKRLEFFLIAILLLALTALPIHCQSANESVVEKLNALVEQDKEGLINATQDLVRIKSVRDVPQPGAPFGEGPAKALEKALQIASDLGFATTNLDGYIGYAEYGQGDEYVAVLAHMDVVPDGDGWTYPPYGAEIHDGRIYGRGAIDDKGPAMAALYALKAVRDANLTLGKRVRVIFGCSEETGGPDVEHYLLREKEPVSGFTPDAYFPAIYAEKGLMSFDMSKNLTDDISDNISEEPRGDIRIISLQEGTAYNIVPDKAVARIQAADPDQVAAACDAFAGMTGYNLSAEIAAEKDGAARTIRITSLGKAAHGSTPEKGKNAAMQLIAFLATLDMGSAEMSEAIRFLSASIGTETDSKSFGLAMEDEPSGNLTLCVGLVNATPERVVLCLNIRYPVTYSFQDVMGRFNQTIEGTGFVAENWQANQSPLFYPKDSPLIMTLTRVYAEQTGRNDSAIAIGGGTYAKEMPNIVASGPMMPGQEEVEHQANEYIAIDQLINVTKIYALGIYELAK